MAKANGTMLACKVTVGMFSTERGVVVELPDGRRVSALVDERSVIVSQEPRPGGEVPGRVRVSVIELEENSAIVDLPQAGFTEGPRLRVPRAFLRQGQRDPQQWRNPASHS